MREVSEIYSRGRFKRGGLGKAEHYVNRDNVRMIYRSGRFIRQDQKEEAATDKMKTTYLGGVIYHLSISPALLLWRPAFEN